MKDVIQTPREVMLEWVLEAVAFVAWCGAVAMVARLTAAYWPKRIFPVVFIAAVLCHSVETSMRWRAESKIHKRVMEEIRKRG